MFWRRTALLACVGLVAAFGSGCVATDAARVAELEAEVASLRTQLVQRAALPPASVAATPVIDPARGNRVLEGAGIVGVINVASAASRGRRWLGVQIVAVRPGSIAALAGLRAGDVVVKANGWLTPAWERWWDAGAVAEHFASLLSRPGRNVLEVQRFDQHCDWRDGELRLLMPPTLTVELVLA